jgi:hypothetical protein
VRYIIAVGESEDKPSFEEVVQEFVNDGWRPVGGVSVVMIGTYGNNSIYEGSPILRFYQAMTRAE